MSKRSKDVKTCTTINNKVQNILKETEVSKNLN